MEKYTEKTKTFACHYGIWIIFFMGIQCAFPIRVLAFGRFRRSALTFWWFISLEDFSGRLFFDVEQLTSGGFKTVFRFL